MKQETQAQAQELTPKTATQILDDLDARRCSSAQAEAAAERRGILEEYRVEYEVRAKAIRQQVAEDDSDAAVYFRDLERIERALNM